MNEDEMRTFLEVARAGTLSSASERLYVSQSTVSRRLDVLESRLRTRLLDRGRGNRTVTLTPSGQRLFAICEVWESLAAEAALVGEQRQTLVVAGASSVCHYLLLPILQRLRADAPEIQPKIVVADEDELYVRLARHEIHVAFGPDHRQPDLEAVPISSEEMVVVSGSSIQSRGGTIASGQLDPSCQVYIHWGLEYLNWHRERWGIRQPALQVAVASLAPPFLRAANSWALVPVSMANSISRRGLRVYRLSDGPPKRVVYRLVPRTLPVSIREEVRRLLDSVERSEADLRRITAISPAVARPRSVARRSRRTA